MKKKMRKREVKKKIAFLLALSMVFSFSHGMIAGASYSNIGNESHEMNETVQSENGTDNILPENQILISEDIHEEIETITEANAEILQSAANSYNAGRIDVSIGTALFLDGDIDFTITLTNTQGYSQDNVITLSNFSEEKISFYDLADGEYTVTVTSPGFAAYSQDITVLQKGYLLKLTAGFCEGYTYTNGGLHPGVLLIGDADGDGDVDDDDKNILVDAIDFQTVSGDYVTDLNKDNETDLLDLMLFSKIYGETKDTTAAIEKFIPASAINAAISEGTNAEGDIKKMLDGDGAIILTPSDKGEISASNPVSMEFDFLKDGNASVVDGIVFETGNDNPVAEAFIGITYVENGIEHEVTVPVKSGVDYLLKESDVYAELDENGGIQVHLGTQAAIKKVTLTITAMQNSNNLAEISKVEFVNGMESRIPEPEMDVPENLKAEPGSESFVIGWDSCVNVTGYEVKIEQGNTEETVIATSNSIRVSSFGGKEVKNYTTYKVSVQSINGTWRSGYCASVEVTPKPSGPPDKPDNVSASGRYKSINVSWKNMDDTLSYNVFYKKRGSNEEYIKISDITVNKYTIVNLDELTEYEIYVTGRNELGESPESIHCAAKTADLNPAEMPKYNMINRDEFGTPGNAHIVSVTRNGGSMIDSEADAGENNSAWGTVDNNAGSYYSKPTWDDGGFNAMRNKGLIYTFDDEYKIDTIALLATDGMQYSYVKIGWWDKDGNAAAVSASCQQRKDAEGRIYHVIKLPYAVNAKQLHVCLARYLATSAYQLITVSEAYFYHYDTLRDEIMALYIDDLHTILRDDVTQETIDALREKVNAPDEFGEENPNKAALLRELETAEKILNDEALNSAVEIHNGITTKDAGRGFSGLNAWQPLGVSAAAGETITVYVGHNTKSTGDNTDLRLIITQYHTESGGVVVDGANLKVGANEIVIPRKNSSVGAESGGALYVQYQANNANDRYSVRVSGGTEVPFLDLYKVTDENERMERTVAFVEALEKHTAEMESLHNELHSGSGNKSLEYTYDKQNCILGASDIMLDTMMLSLPAHQMLAGAGSGSAEKRAETILKSMTAMEDMMYLFYQHKGLNASAPAELNQIPKGHLNIRYQRMFSGAFMYASGNHIGIEWNETKGMMNAVPVVSDENGRYVSGRYFGWGIAHEIGHCINQNSYAVAEITNNYFAQLAQAKNTNAGMRFSYDNVYSKVTSGTKGASQNVATQLGMYWQLHLAYDSGLNYMTYPDYTEQLKNLFYARVDSYSRNPASAPAPDNIKLELGKNTDQNLMRLSCAAAEKNILEFFERWGKEPNEQTIAYAQQFEKETRAIFYVSDDSHMYALKGKGSVLAADGSVTAIKNVSVNIGSQPNKAEKRKRLR